MSRELIVRPLGLVTRPNQYGQYPIGGLSSAINCVMRAPGILEAAPATVLGTSWGATNDVAEELFPLDNGKIMMWNRSSTTWTVRHAGANTYTLPTGFSSTNLFTSNRITHDRARGRVLMSSLQGHLVSDTTDPSGAQTLRRAGLPQVCIGQAVAVSGEVFTAVAQACTYAIVVRRKFGDGYELASAPGPIFRFITTGAGPSNVQVSAIVESTRIITGDIIELYRSNRIDQAVATTDPGSTLFLVQSVVHDGSTSIVIEDKATFGALGETSGKALYTNPGQQGALASNRQPNLAKASAMYKGYRFLGNITERPRMVLRSPGGLQFDVDAGLTTGVYAGARANGIGRRGFTGTTSSGNPTITAISAAEIVGIVPGQSYRAGGRFSGAARVVSVGATTVTMDENASGTGATTHALEDMIEINGSSYFMSTFGASVFSLTSAYQFEVTAAQTYGITDPQLAAAQELIIEPKTPSDFLTGFSVRATNGANYSPALPEIGAATPSTFVAQTIANGWNWSKGDQPEHFPAPNTALLGSSEVIAFESTRDAVWAFCTDGLYRISGDGGQWRVDTVDTTCVLAAPRASCVLREVVYAYTNAGFVRITDGGVEPLSQRIVGDLLPGAEYTETATIIVEKNEIEDEVIVRLSSSQVYVYSVRENAYTTLAELDVTCMAYARYPVSGSPAIAFGRSPSGSAPRYELWNSTSSWLGMTARFQPMFAGDPFTAKQWIDGTFVFSSTSGSPSVTPAWNGNASAAFQASGSPKYVNEARALFGVPRAAALGNTLCPGFAIGARGNTTQFLALSMRYRQFGEQHLKR